MPSQPAIVTIGKRIIEDLERRFDALDTDEDDEIELDELFRLYETGSGASEAILRFYDASGDNVIDRDEFKKVGLVLLSNQKFRVADVDESGALSLAEFTNALTGMGFTKKFAREIFRRADGDKNGEIDQMEFLDAMLLFVADYDDILEAVGDGDDDDGDDDGDDTSGGKGEPVVDDQKPPSKGEDQTPSGGGSGGGGGGGGSGGGGGDAVSPPQTLGSKIMQVLGEEFDDLDVNRTGFLTDGEIREIPAANKVLKVQQLLNYLDLDGDDSISRPEFINVGLLANVKQLFAKYDANGNGSLSPDELNVLLQRDLGYTAQEARQVFQSADRNGDGGIGEMEFYTALLLCIAAPKDSSQIKLFLNDEIDDDDEEMRFPEDIKVNTDTSLMNLHFSVLREIVDGDKTVKRTYKAVFPTRLQGKLLDDEDADEEEEEDGPALTYEMDPNFFEESVGIKNVIDLKYSQPIWMGSNEAIQFTVIVQMIFDKKTPGSNIVMTGTKEVVIPIKIQTLKSAQEQELILTANKVAQLAPIP